ncbi:hypothetical protein [Paludisphaera soli]|uniref:hypothetical protein n=1 Tax=Paludisphaera soli TaxID=2712865 RepID=UPI0013EB359F|nr:hypothetical protein [Paludisphaera soli]
MGRIEALSQFIVPLIFLAIWALTSILNRDAQPLPQRPARPGNRPGPNALGPAARGQAATGAIREREVAAASAPPPRRLGTESTPSPVASRPQERPAQPPGLRLGRRPAGDGMAEADVYVIDDELIFVDPVSRMQIGSAPAPGLGGARNPSRQVARKPARGRRSEHPGGRERHEDPGTQRVLSEQVGQSMSLNRGQPLDLAPLTSKLTSLGGASLRNATSTAATVASSIAPPALSATQVRDMFADTPRLREMALLTELLQPPLSLRQSRRGR